MAGNVFMQNIDVKGWTNLLSLMDRNTLRRLAGEVEGLRPERTRLVILFEGDRLLGAHHSEKGSVLESFTWNGPTGIEAIAQREGVDEVSAIERDAPERLYSRFKNKLNLRGDYIKQALEIYELIRLEAVSGLYFYPPPRMKRIDHNKLPKGFNFGIGDNSTMLFYLFDGDDVWASLIVVVKGGNIDFVSSHNALVEQGVNIGKWRKDYKKIISASGRVFRKPSIGVFCDIAAFARILRSKKTLKAFGEARKKKDIILEPLPLRLKTVLGAGKLFGM